MTKSDNKAKITKDMLIMDVAHNYPESVPVMFESGMHCIGCGMARMETLEQGCKGHGMSDEDVDRMVAEMNDVLKKDNKIKTK